MALLARAVDQRLEQGGDPVACLVGALLSEVGVIDDVGQAAVLGLEAQDALQIGAEAAPGIWVFQRLLGERGDLVETLLEERFDDLLLVGEAPVGGADPNAGVRCDVVHRHVEPALREDLAGRGQQPSAVALGVLAQRTLSDVLGGHGRTVAVYGHAMSG